MASETQAVPTANLIRTGRAARILGCSPGWVLTLARDGKINSVVIDGYCYFDRREIAALAREREGSVAHAN